MKNTNKPGTGNKTGRPSKYSEEIADKICELISTTSRGLNDICKELKVHPVTVYRWVEDIEAFRNKYTRAREAQADLLADEIISIADDGSRDTKTIKKGGELIEVEDTEWTNRSKLRVEARKWIASKLKPKKYGDKLDMTSDGEKITSVNVTVVKSDAPLSGSEKDVTL